MTFTIDIREDIYYQQGVSDTVEKTIISMLTQIDLNIAQIANFTSSTEAFVEKIKKTLSKSKKK